jgi:hypothetical protein
MGFDQLMVWYNHFCVVSAKLILTTSNLSGPTTVCLRIDADSTPITVIDRIVELGGCVIESLEGKSVSGSLRKMQLSLDVAKLQGVSRIALTADANLRGTAAASPAEISYFHVTTWNTAASTTSTQFDAILEQTATFFEPRDVSESFAMRAGPCRVALNKPDPVSNQENKTPGWFS